MEENITEEKLWNELTEKSYYKNNQELYFQHILEQYKIYVEMADKISARRNLTNVFFLTLHTTIIGATGFSLEKLPLIDPNWLLLFPLLAILLLCIVWLWLLVSYRQLNTAKYEVIGFLEKKLPSSPYWSAEWSALGEGKDWRKYLPLTKLEIIVPICFMVLYIMIFTYLLITST